MRRIRNVAFTGHLLLVNGARGLTVNDDRVFLLYDVYFLLAFLVDVNRNLQAPMIRCHDATVSTTRSFLIRARLTGLLSTMRRREVLLRRRARNYYEGHLRNTATRRITNCTLLVVILRRMRRIVTSIVRRLPLIDSANYQALAAGRATGAVVRTRLVMRVVRSHLRVITVLIEVVRLASGGSVEGLKLRGHHDM